MQDPREAAEVIGRTAQLTFHPVLGVATPTPPTRRTPTADHASRRRRGELVLPDETRPATCGSARPALTGEGVDGAEAAIDPQAARRLVRHHRLQGHGGQARGRS